MRTMLAPGYTKDCGMLIYSIERMLYFSRLCFKNEAHKKSIEKLSDRAVFKK